jgi:WD40 repeat protein
MSIDFLNYKLGHSIQSDVLFGTSQGEITTYCAGKHFVINESAHKGSVNCLKVSDKINDQVNIISGGEDGLIKIWDSSMTLLQSIDVR